MDARNREASCALGPLNWWSWRDSC